MTDTPVSLNDLRIYSLRLLAKREYAVNELRERVCTKWRGEEGIGELADQLVTELVGEGSLSDQRYAAAFVRSRVQRSQGPLKIRAELRQRKLADAEVEQALDANDEFWVELATDWLSRQYAGELAYEDRARFYRRLVSRGFSHEHAMAALAAKPTG